MHGEKPRATSGERDVKRDGKKDASQQRSRTFNKGSKSRVFLRPLFAMLALGVAAAIAIAFLGLTVGNWFGAFAVSSSVAIAILGICIAGILPLRFARRWPFFSNPVARLALLVGGMILLMLPVVLAGPQNHPDASAQPDAPGINPFIGMLLAVYSAVQMVGFEMSFDAWLSSAAEPWLMITHAFLVFVYALACPVAAVFAAFNAFVNGFSGLQIRFLSWCESIGNKAREIYVFHELDENGYRLACDIFKERGDGVPFLVFANVGDAEASRDETLMEDLVDRSKGRGFVVFTSAPAESIPAKLSRKAQQKCTIRYFSVSQTSSANVTTTVMIWDALFAQLWDAAWPIFDKHKSELVTKDDKGDKGNEDEAGGKDGKDGKGDEDEAGGKDGKDGKGDEDEAGGKDGKDGKGDDKKTYANLKTLNNRLKLVLEKSDSEVRAMAESRDGMLDNELARLVMLGTRMSIHCLHTYSEDSLILDGLAGRTLETLRDELGVVEPDPKGKDDPKEDPYFGLKSFVETLCNLVEVRLLSQMRVSVCDVLSEHPLYEALDSIDLRREGPIAEQTLTVLIVGAGAYGTEALRTVFWLGRFARVRLRIVVVEREDVQALMRRLYAEAPEMMCEHACREEDLGHVRGKWTYKIRYEDPTIMFCQMDAFDSTMDDLVSGKKVGAYYFDGKPGTARIERHERVLMTPDDHVYSMVCLDTDDASLGAALLLQRRLGLRSAQAQNRMPESVAARFLNGDKGAGCKSPIALRVRNADALASLSEMAKDSPAGGLWDCGFPLYPFGSIEDLFSYAMVARDENEVRARYTNSAYGIVCSGMDRNAFCARTSYNALSEFLKMSNRSHVISIRYRLWMVGLKTTSTDKDYEKALGIEGRANLAKLVCEKGFFSKDRLDSVGGRLLDSFEKYEMYVRSELPILCYLSDLEHVRWVAFHRTFGWRDAEPYVHLNEAGKYKHLVSPSFKEQKHEGLRLHYYLCNSIDELRKRGERLGKDPHAYDRMMVREDLRILRDRADETETKS